MDQQSEIAKLADSAESFEIRRDLFPAPMKTAQASIGGISTDFAVLSFADKIIVQIAQNGTLNHWIHVPLNTPTSDLQPGSLPPISYDEDGEERKEQEDNSLLPLPHLTTITLLGGTIPERATVGHLLASQIASAVARRNPDDRRGVIVGMGIKKATLDRDEFIDIMTTFASCL